MVRVLLLFGLIYSKIPFCLAFSKIKHPLWFTLSLSLINYTFLFRHIFQILEMSKFPQFDCLSEFKFKIDDLLSRDRLDLLKNIYKKWDKRYVSQNWISSKGVHNPEKSSISIFFSVSDLLLLDNSAWLRSKRISQHLMDKIFDLNM